MLGDRVQPTNPRTENITFETEMLPEYIRKLSGSKYFVDIMQRDYIWLYRKSKQIKTIEALISEKIGKLLITKIFDDKYSEISQILIGRHKVTSDLIQHSRFNKIVSSIDENFKNAKGTILRGDRINISQLHDEHIDSIIDGNQRSTTTLLMFNGNLKNAEGELCFPILKLCDINISTSKLTYVESVELLMKTEKDFVYDTTKNGYLYFHNEGKIVSCYIKLNYFYKRWMCKGTKTLSDSFLLNIQEEINYRLGQNRIGSVSDSNSSMNIIIERLYEIFTKMKVRLTVYHEPSLSDALVIFRNANSGIKLDDKESMYAILSRESFYRGDPRNRFESVKVKTDAMGYSFTEDDIFAVMYYIANRKSGNDNNFPATMKTIYESYDDNRDVHDELSKRFSFYEKILLRTLKMIKNKQNLYLIAGKSVVLVRIIARRIRHLSDSDDTVTYWSETSNEYKKIENEVFNFAFLGALNKVYSTNGTYFTFRSHIDNNNPLDSHWSLRKMTTGQAMSYLTSPIDMRSKNSKICKDIAAVTSPHIKMEMKPNNDHIFAMKLFKDKKIKQKPNAANFIYLSQEDNTSKQDKLPYDFLVSRDQDFLKEYSQYLVGINCVNGIYEVDQNLKNPSYYPQHNKDMASLKLGILKSLGFVI